MGCGRRWEGKRRLPLCPQCPRHSRPYTEGPTVSRGRRRLPHSGGFHGHMHVLPQPPVCRPSPRHTPDPGEGCAWPAAP